MIDYSILIISQNVKPTIYKGRDTYSTIIKVL